MSSTSAISRVIWLKIDSTTILSEVVSSTGRRRPWRERLNTVANTARSMPTARQDKATARAAMERTHRWALRSLAARTRPEQALFAIVQGGVFSALRRESADFLTQQPFDGFALGGLAVGDTRAEREDITHFAAQLLPAERPRYLMGVGTPPDLLEAMLAGTPMVATAVGGIPEVITDAVHGALVPPRTPARLTGAIAAALDDGPRARSLAEKARRHATESLSLQRMLADVDTVYQAVLAEAHVI